MAVTDPAYPDTAIATSHSMSVKPGDRPEASGAIFLCRMGAGFPFPDALCPFVRPVCPLSPSRRAAIAPRPRERGQVDANAEMTRIVQGYERRGFDLT